MEKIDPRHIIQEEAFDAWVDSKRRGTIEAITGIGKTFIALRAINELSEDSKILYLAETNQRWRDLDNNIEEFKKIYGIDLSNRNIQKMCYQSAYKKKDMSHDLVICDEIHESLTSEYGKYYVNNCYIRIMGLSATIEESNLEIFSRNMTKMKFLDEHAPICFKYNISDGQRDCTARPINLTVIPHKLDSKKKNIIAGTRSTPFMTSEAASYAYWDSKFKRSLYMEPDRRQFLLRYYSRKRAELLYGLPSKIEVVKELLEDIKGKTLIFGNDLKLLESITPNVVRSAPKGTNKSSQEAKNSQILNDFDKGTIQLIASFKMLKQGANLKDLDNVIIVSYYGKLRDFIQRIGRLRLDGGKIGNIHIIVTEDTQEEVWFDGFYKLINNINNESNDKK